MVLLTMSSRKEMADDFKVFSSQAEQRVSKIEHDPDSKFRFDLATD